MYKVVFSLLVVLFLSGCLHYPKAVEKYDEECGVLRKEYKLAKTEGMTFGKCSTTSGAGCLAEFAAIISYFVIERVVAESVVLAGNSLVWLEKQQDCKEGSIEHRSELVKALIEEEKRKGVEVILIEDLEQPLNDKK